MSDWISIHLSNLEIYTGTNANYEEGHLLRCTTCKQFVPVSDFSFTAMANEPLEIDITFRPCMDNDCHIMQTLALEPSNSNNMFWGWSAHGGEDIRTPLLHTDGWIRAVLLCKTIPFKSDFQKPEVIYVKSVEYLYKRYPRN